MDGSELRRGQATIHRSLARLHEGPGAEAFGRAGGILLGTLSLSWSDALLSSCDVPPDRLRAAHRLFDAMRTEVISGQYLDMLGPAPRRGERRAGADDDPLQDGQVHRRAAAADRRRSWPGASPPCCAAYSRVRAAARRGVPAPRRRTRHVRLRPARPASRPLDDLREGKHTVLVAHALARATPGQQAYLDTWHGNPELGRGAGGRAPPHPAARRARSTRSSR